MLTSILTLALFGILLLMLETFLPGMIAGIIGTLSLIAAVWLIPSVDRINTLPFAVVRAESTLTRLPSTKVVPLPAVLMVAFRST